MFYIERPILALLFEVARGKGVELWVISSHKIDNLFFRNLLVSSDVGGLPDFFLSVLIPP